MIASRRLLIALAVVLLHACSTQPPEPPREAEPAIVEPAPEPAVVYKPFARDTLYSLLVAEFAGKRGQPDLALGYYLDEARKTHDVGVISRASQLARVLRKDRAALDAAMLWVEQAPDSPEAHFINALALSSNARHLDALNEMQKVADLGGMTNYTTLIVATLEAPIDVREQALARIDAALKANPEDLDLMVSRVLLLEKAGKPENALAQLRAARAIEPSNTKLVSMEAKLLTQLGREQEALDVYKNTLEQFPNDQRLRLQYARILTRNNLPAAEEQFAILAAQDPTDSVVMFSLALIEYENEKLEKSKEHLIQLLALGERNNDAHYYLGRIAQRQNDRNGALTHFSQVRGGDSYLPALKQRLTLHLEAKDIDGARRVLAEAREANPDEQVRLTVLEADMLVDLKRHKDAQTLLTDALRRNPNNFQLLYARSLVADKLGDMKMLEADLRAILAKDPDNAMALNALGYSLADKGTRLNEARELIERAYKLNPDDPAVMDSMGWIHYRLKNFDRAEQMLRAAYSLMPDHEVAAHLGEVLWAKGDKDRAREIWRAGLEQQPDSMPIEQALRRFGLTREAILPPQATPAPAP